ncbi:MAG: hypothetical protein AAF721_09765 [Myxococcota bacterium]
MLAAALAAPGCQADSDFEDALDFSGPVATRSSVTWYDNTHGELLVATPGAAELDLRRVPLGDDATRMLWSRATVDGDALLVLLGPASDKQEDVEETLMIVPADGQGEVRELDVLAPFTAVALSPDGLRAVLYFGPTATTGGLHNANQVAIVDLVAGTARNLTLNGFGGQVRSVQFTNHGVEATAAVQVGPRQRELIAFLAEEELVLVDAADETADQVSVTFRDTAGFAPTETLLRVGNDMFDSPVLFVRGQAGSDVAMLTVVDKNDTATGNPGFSAQVSLLPVGDSATDFAAFDGVEAPYLVTAGAGSPGLWFTDIRTQAQFVVPLEGPVDSVVLRDEQTALGPVRQAVAWAQGGNAVHTLRLDEIESAVGRAPERLDVETGIEQLVLLDNDRALVGSGLVLYVVDFAKRQVTPLRSQVPYDAATSALAGDRLLLGTPGQSWVSSVDLTTLNPESMILDDVISNFFYMPASGKLVAIHPDAAGHLTVADAADPSRAESYSVWGLALDGIFNPPSED